MTKRYDITGIGSLIYGYLIKVSDETLKGLGLSAGRHGMVLYPKERFESVMSKAIERLGTSASSITNVMMSNRLSGGVSKYIGFGTSGVHTKRLTNILQ